MLPFLYILLFLEALILGWILTGLSLRLAPRLGFMDQPGTRKVHLAIKPRLGGVGIYGAFLLVLVINAIAAVSLGETTLHRWFPIPLANIRFVSSKLAAVLIGSFIVFAVGLIDDRRRLPPGIKLAAQILAVLPLLAEGIQIRSFLPPEFGMILTVFWVVFLTNAFNFIDNMDGLCAGVATICLLVFATLSYLGGHWFMVAIFVTLAGALVGFLRYNWFPSKIFMGDAGALSVGYLIAAMSIMATYYTRHAPTAFPILAPVVVLGLPIFDSLTVFAIRIKQRRPLWVGDTSHFSHRLVALGMTQRQAVLFIYLVTLAMGLGALPLRILPPPEAVLQTLLILSVFVIIAFLETVGSNDPNRNRPNG